MVAYLACESWFCEERNPGALFAVTHPAVMSLYHDNGVDVCHSLPRECLDEFLRDVRIEDGDRSSVEVAVGTTTEQSLCESGTASPSKPPDYWRRSTVSTSGWWA